MLQRTEVRIVKSSLLKSLFSLVAVLLCEYKHCCYISNLVLILCQSHCFINTTLQKWWPYFCLQGPEHCSSLNFGLGSSGPVLGISGSELEAGVEYTFKLTISKDGMAPESTTQTVSAHMHLHILIRMHAFCWRFPNKINLRAHRRINGIERRKTIIVLLHKWVVWSFTALNFEPYTDID